MGTYIQFSCPACGKGLRARAEIAGKKTRCHCGEILSIPGISNGQDAPSASNEATLAIRRLSKMISDRFGVMDEEEAIAEVETHLKAAGAEGTRALVNLIEDALQCRGGGIGFAIAVARRQPASPELIEVLNKVASAFPLAPRPLSPRFRGEMEGGGQVGWADQTYKRIREMAAGAIEKMTKGTDSGRPAVSLQQEPSVAESEAAKCDPKSLRIKVDTIGELQSHLFVIFIAPGFWTEAQSGTDVQELRRRSGPRAHYLSESVHFSTAEQSREYLNGAREYSKLSEEARHSLRYLKELFLGTQAKVVLLRQVNPEVAPQTGKYNPISCMLFSLHGQPTPKQLDDPVKARARLLDVPN